jgi:adenylosuccinate lyase
MNNTNPVFSLSPLDGRYQSKVNSLSEYLSEFAYIKYRVQVEIKYLMYFTSHILHKSLDQKSLIALINNFDEQDVLKIKEIEKITKHDVKAIEYYLREKTDLSSYIHFGLTSEDVNNIAYSLMLKDGLQQVIIPELHELSALLIHLSEKYKNASMLARTHGQPAVPTTMGKEIFVFAKRLQDELEFLTNLPIEAKLNGAVGNYNALIAAYPNVDWIYISSDFIKSLGLKQNLYTTQILPSDNYIKIFQSIHLINAILLGFSQDLWRYISDGYFIQKVNENEVGSSTMPQKVNPIDFENAEGNLGFANAMLDFFTNKLPISRLQRDLSDSTVKRNFGVALGHALLAYKSCIAGLNKLEFNQQFADKDLDAHWEIITEGIQTILRSHDDSQAYEKLKTFSRGKQLNQDMIKRFVNSLEISEEMKQKLLQITPHSYLGLASQLVSKGIKE